MAETILDLIPSSASIVCLSLAPDIKVSVVLPAHKRSITAVDDRSQFEHDLCKQKCPYFHDHVENKIEYGTDFYDRSENQNKCPGMDNLRSFGMNTPCRKNKTVESFRSFTVDVPATLWSLTIPELYNSRDVLISTVKRNKTGAKGRLHQFYVKDFTNDLLLRPFPYPNVYDTGTICWGSNNDPSTTRDAVNIYWSAPFNADLLSNYQFSLKHTLQNRDFESNWLNWTSYKDRILGSRSFTTTSKCDGIWFSFNPEHVEAVPSQFRLQLPKQRSRNENGDRVFNTEPGVLGWFTFSERENYYYIKLLQESSSETFLIRKKALTDKAKIYPIGITSRIA